jgi:hypothetical protein
MPSQSGPARKPRTVRLSFCGRPTLQWYHLRSVNDAEAPPFRHPAILFGARGSSSPSYLLQCKRHALGALGPREEPGVGLQPSVTILNSLLVLLGGSISGCLSLSLSSQCSLADATEANHHPSLPTAVLAMPPTLTHLPAIIARGLPPHSRLMFRANCRDREPQTSAKQAVSTRSGALCLLPQLPSIGAAYYLGVPRTVRNVSQASVRPLWGHQCYAFSIRLVPHLTSGRQV